MADPVDRKKKKPGQGGGNQGGGGSGGSGSTEPTPEQVYLDKINSGLASGELTQEQADRLTSMLMDNANAKGQLGPSLRDALNSNYRQYVSANGGGSGGSGGGGGGGGGNNGGGGSGGGCVDKYGNPPPGYKWEGSVDADGNDSCRLVKSGPNENEQPGRPGAAWTWDGQKWVRPNMPKDGKPYKWDDNLGWQIDEALMAARTNARGYLEGLFKQFGFDPTDSKNLLGMVDDWIKKGLADGGTEPVLMKFRDTDIYKRRFSGMAELIKRGQAISEAEYIQLESSYRNVMQNYGLPKTFYDTPADYAKFIGAGLSVKEVEERVVAAKQSLNPLVSQELQQYYGVSQGTAMAYLLGLTDEKGVAVESARTQEEIRTRGRAAQIGAAAERSGFGMDRAYAERLGGTSVGQTVDPFQMGTLAQLEGTFDQARRIADRETTLAGIDREAFDQRDALAAAFGDEQKKLASERRAKRERARFSGSSGVAASSLGQERNF